MGWEIDVERETKWRTNDDEITTVNNTFCCCCLHTQFALAHEAFACKSLLACFLCFFLSLLLSCFLPFSLFLHHSLPYPPPSLTFSLTIFTLYVPFRFLRPYVDPTPLANIMYNIFPSPIMMAFLRYRICFVSSVVHWETDFHAHIKWFDTWLIFSASTYSKNLLCKWNSPQILINLYSFELERCSHLTSLFVIFFLPCKWLIFVLLYRYKECWANFFFWFA